MYSAGYRWVWYMVVFLYNQYVVLLSVTDTWVEKKMLVSFSIRPLNWQKMYKVLADIHLLRREVSLDVGGEHPTETEEGEARFRKHNSICSVTQWFKITTEGSQWIMTKTCWLINSWCGVSQRVEGWPIEVKAGLSSGIQASTFSARMVRDPLCISICLVCLTYFTTCTNWTTIQLKAVLSTLLCT